MIKIYGITRQQMIEQEVGLPILWDNGDSEYIFCSESLVIEELPDTHEGMGEDDGYTQRVSIASRIGRMVGIDYQDFVKEIPND